LEEKLKLKQISFVKAREDLLVVKEKYIKGESANKGERLTEGGVSYTAVLNICVIEACDLKPLDFIGKSDPYVILKLEDGIEKSSYKPDTLDPFWNEDFVFNVKDKTSTLRVEVFDKDTVGEDDLEGIVEIPLLDLVDQQKVEKWYNLKNENGEEEPGKIKLRLHFVWSLHQYFVDMLKKTDEKIHKIEENLVQLNTFLEHIEKPFGILLFVEIDDKLEKLLVGDSEELLNPVQTRKTVAISKPKPNITTVIEDVFRGTLST
jgi:C2 domain